MSSPKELEESRRIELRELDGTHSIHPHIYFPSNEIKTSKYSIITFLPLNLFEQFHRLANIYFLILVILNWIPQLSVFGKEVSMFPLIFVLAATAVKDIYEDYTRYRSDNEINNRTCLEWKDRRLIEKRWKDVRVGDVIKVEMEKPIPADLVVLTTSNSDHNCFVSTMNLDGETNLKVRKSSSRHEFASFDAEGSIALDPAFDSIICELPHENIYKFLGFINRSVDGKMLDPIPLDAENLLLRGSILRNTQWALGVVIYTGHETKAMLNSRRAPSKRSQLERQMNKMVLVLIILLLLICTACGVGTSLWEKNSPQELVEIILGPRLGSTLSGFLNFLSSIIVFQVMIPIAIYISVDVVNIFQVYFINRDQDLFHHETNQRMTCRALNIHSDLGQVHYIFSDKTGTLTCNRQTFHQCTVRGSRYSSPDIDDLPFPKLSKATRRLSNPNPDLGTQQDPFLHFFMLTLCICNTAMIDILHESDVDGIPSYQSESPDEVALVKAAARCGYVLQARSSDFIKVSIFGKEESFQILALFPFNSDRKRMSILVRSLETNQLLMLTKGADEMIFQRLAQNEAEQPTILNIQSQLTEFSEKGLRTLCLAYRIWEETELENWTVQFSEASSVLEQRETLLNKMFNESEQNFILLGATAVEDRLQEKVPETISTLYEAEISIWVLTGDMQNTAINVAYSCNLLNSKMDQFILSAEDSEGCLALLNEFAGKMNDHSKPKALIIHGRSLLHLMTEQHEKTFFDFVSKCKIVICCRVSPLQKALVVNLVRKFTDKVTLAIGDGANDVGMIQAAHVGIGISGQEGRQAVMSSDFAIGEFRFLRDLLIVHGHWSYYRLAIFIFYFLYKNALFVMLLFWFQIYCAWSNQTPIDDLDLILYNMAYTLLPVIANAVFDMDIDRRVLLDNPWLYRIGQKNRLFKMRSFMLLMVDLLWQSVVITFLPIYLYWERGPYLFELGIPILTSSLIVVTLHLCLDTLHWTWVQHVIYWGSLIAYLPLNLIFDATPGSLNYRMLLEGLEDPLFYVTCLLTSVLAILPRFTAKASLGIFHPDLIAQARRFHSKKKKKKKIEKTDELTALKSDAPKANYLETVNLV